LRIANVTELLCSTFRKTEDNESEILSDDPKLVAFCFVVTKQRMTLNANVERNRIEFCQSKMEMSSRERQNLVAKVARNDCPAPRG
jgi:hypothetical protein